jgi:hypothetical protein
MSDVRLNAGSHALSLIILAGGFSLHSFLCFSLLFVDVAIIPLAHTSFLELLGLDLSLCEFLISGFLVDSLGLFCDDLIARTCSLIFEFVRDENTF